MWEESFRRVIRLRLLALVLAFALTWYALNPAPGPARRVEGGGEEPNEERREANSPASVSYELEMMKVDTTRAVAYSFSPAAQDINDLEWPEVIDLG